MTPRRLPPTVVLATGNAGKLREMREILAPWNVEVRSVDEFVCNVHGAVRCHHFGAAGPPATALAACAPETVRSRFSGVCKAPAK